MSTEQPEARGVCEHFYASHCYRGMSIGLCMTCGEPDWDDLAEQLAVAAAVDRAEAAEAKLAEIAAYVREHKGDEGFSWVHALDILHIIGSNEEVCPGGC